MNATGWRTAGSTPTTAELTSMIQPSATHGDVSIDTSAVDFATAGTYTARSPPGR